VEFVSLDGVMAAPRGEPNLKYPGGPSSSTAATTANNSS
jgi:hypothetical protein